MGIQVLPAQIFQLHKYFLPMCKRQYQQFHGLQGVVKNSLLKRNIEHLEIQIQGSGRTADVIPHYYLQRVQPGKHRLSDKQQVIVAMPPPYVEFDDIQKKEFVKRHVGKYAVVRVLECGGFDIALVNNDMPNKVTLSLEEASGLKTKNKIKAQIIKT